MNPEALVRKIEAEQALLARALLSTPRGHDAFEYGRSVGLYEGYENVKNLLLNIFAEAEKKQFNA
jgi:hypothetical protein